MTQTENFSRVSHDGTQVDQLLSGLPRDEIIFATSSSHIPGTDSSIIAELNKGNSDWEIKNNEESPNITNLTGNNTELMNTRKRTLSSSPPSCNFPLDFTSLDFPDLFSSSGTRKKRFHKSNSNEPRVVENTSEELENPSKTPAMNASQSSGSRVEKADQEIIVDRDEQNEMEFMGFDDFEQNQTQSSSQKNQTIIIKPLEDHRDPKKFFSNEIAIVKGLEASNFNRCNIIDSHTNMSKKLLILQIQLKEGISLEELLSIDEIGDWKVQCRLPILQRVCYGVVGPIGIETTNEATLATQLYMSLELPKEKKKPSVLKLRSKGLNFRID